MAGGTIDLDEIASPEIIEVIGTAAPGSSRLDLGGTPFRSASGPPRAADLLRSPVQGLSTMRQKKRCIPASRIAISAAGQLHRRARDPAPVLAPLISNGHPSRKAGLPSIPSALALILAKPTLRSFSQNGTKPQRIRSRLRSAARGSYRTIGSGSVGATFQLGAMFGVARCGGIEKTSLISLTSEERRARPHMART